MLNSFKKQYFKKEKLNKGPKIKCLTINNTMQYITVDYSFSQKRSVINNLNMGGHINMSNWSELINKLPYWNLIKQIFNNLVDMSYNFKDS